MGERDATLSSFLEGEPTEEWGPPTYRVEAGRCGACGEAVTVRWRDGNSLVCGGCKTW